MNIIMLSSDYLPNIGGIASHIFYLSKHLKMIGNNIIIINPLPSDHDEISVTEDNGMLVYKIYYKDAKHLWDRNRDKQIYYGIRQAKKELGSVDIIHQHDYCPNILLKLFTSKDIAWIWTNHSSMFLMDYAQPQKRKKLKMYYMMNTKGIITVSEEIYEKSKYLWGKRIPITYIPNGVDIELFTPDINIDRFKHNLKDSDFAILCPRRMVKKNGVIFFAEAINIILEKRPDVNWQFLFLGSDQASNTDRDYIDEVKHTLKSAYDNGYIKYMGNVPMSKMPEINLLADIVVIPSLIEAVSLSALEAMATCKPVIATNVGGLPEIIKNQQTGLLIEPQNPEAIAEAILSLYDNVYLRNIIAKQGYELAINNYSWNIISENTIKFYNMVKMTTR